MADSSKPGFLNSLFQWTMKSTAAEAKPTTPNEPAQPLADEIKKPLGEPLQTTTANPRERLKISINKIKDKQTPDDQRQDFLKELCHWAEEIDLAKDFFAVGGLDILRFLLEHQDDQIRMHTCSLLATLIQNNEQCQRIIVQSGLQEKLLKIVDQSDNPELKTKAVTAISALIRGFTLGQLQLQKFQGVKILIRTLALPVPRLQNKLCFLINTICTSSAHMKKIFFDNGALAELMRLFNSETCSDHQQVLETIRTLSEAKPKAFVKYDSLLIDEFREKLNARLATLSEPDEHQDEIAVINQLHLSIQKSTGESEKATAQ